MLYFIYCVVKSIKISVWITIRNYGPDFCTRLYTGVGWRYLEQLLITASMINTKKFLWGEEQNLGLRGPYVKPLTQPSTVERSTCEIRKLLYLLKQKKPGYVVNKRGGLDYDDVINRSFVCYVVSRLASKPVIINAISFNCVIFCCM